MGNYIKLPPIPDSFGNEELLFLWEYAKESDEDKKRVHKYLKMILDNEKKCKSFENLMKQIIYDPKEYGNETDAKPEDSVVKLLKDMQKHMFFMICQIHEKIQKKYYEESKEIPEIACEIGVPEEWVEIVIRGFE